MHQRIAVELGIDFLGGALVGAVLGQILTLVVSRIDQGGPAEVTLSVALAYLASPWPRPTPTSPAWWR